jgi:hypothetical protein
VDESLVGARTRGVVDRGYKSAPRGQQRPAEIEEVEEIARRSCRGQLLGEDTAAALARITETAPDDPDVEPPRQDLCGPGL